MELKNRIGYACINMELAKEGVTTNRDIRLATMQKENSMDILSAKALANVQGLKRIVEWNTEKGIKFYRMSSNIFPWWSKYKFTDLKDWDQIKECLEYVGKFARDNDQRLSFHPSHFVVLGSKNPQTRWKARLDLERHSEMLDIMGFEPSHWNKLNIHIGSAQGGKEQMMKDWASSFKKLSPNCQARIVVENDDKANMYSVQDLYDGIYKNIGVPITFDTFHHEVGAQGGLTKHEAANLAASTWPKGMFVIHHSSSKRLYEQADARYNQHASYIYDTIEDFGTNAWIMVESKAKERAILGYLNNGPMEPMIQERTLDEC